MRQKVFKECVAAASMLMILRQILADAGKGAITHAFALLHNFGG
jgi:hypothetical protein